MNTTRSSLLIALFIIVGIALSASLFVVKETERAIILRLGDMQLDAQGEPKVLAPGLHFRVPFIDTIRFFDRRLRTLDIPSARIPTEEKKEVLVDLFAKWRIRDFALFFKTTGSDPMHAERLLREKTIDGLRTEIGRRQLNDVVSSSRELVMQTIGQDINKTAQSLGIDVVDARVKRIDLPDQVSTAVFGLMRTERKRVASEHRARGQSRSEAIKANADARVTVILAQANKQALQLRGQGDADAAKIYAQAYGAEPEFYRFYRSLEAYKKTFRDKSDMLVIKPDSEFFQYFHQPHAKQAENSAE
jgi:membrane protease subunit HflC